MKPKSQKMKRNKTPIQPRPSIKLSLTTSIVFLRRLTGMAVEKWT